MLDSSERKKIEDALELARASSPNLEDRIYADVYDAIREIFQGQSEVDPYSIIWLEGAAKINRGEGFYSDFIRAYTRQQVETRWGEDPSDGDLQKASNQIAEAVIKDVLDLGALPDIHRIAKEDANGVADVFGGNFAIWSGNILFLLLNHDQSFNTNIIGSEGETYDALLAFETAEDAYRTADLQSAINAFEGLEGLEAVFRDFVTIASDFPDLTISVALEAQKRAREFLEGAYGDNFSFTYDALLGNVVLGSENDDPALEGTTAFVLGEIIHAGQGDDTIIGSGITRDIIDGGPGKDVVDYSRIFSFSGLKISLGKQEKGKDLTADFTGFVNGSGLLDQDSIFNVEEIIATPEDDKFVFKDLKGSIESVDAGESEGDLDHLDLRSLPSGILYKNGKIFSREEADSSSGITIKNFEKISFGEQDDLYSESTQSGIKEVYLGGGDDTVLFANPGAQLYGGPGNDIFTAVDKVLIADADADDQIVIGGQTLFGGRRNANSESPYAIGSGGMLYGLNKAGEMVIENAFTGWQTFVAGAQVGPDVPGSQRTAGITLFEYATDAYRLLELPPGFGREDWLDAWFDWLDLFLKTTTGQDRRGVDPLILDLDGDGLELSGLSSISPAFDLDLDGFAEPTGWAIGGDGFLVLDKNDNGLIEDISELFGSPTQAGFDELKTYDLNDDDVIDSQDLVFTDLQVWVDANNDAITDAGELKTLDELGIASFSLQVTPQDRDQVGHYVAAESTFTRTDGTTNAVYDVRFSIDNFNSVYLGDSTVSDAVTALPNIKGKGTLTDLHIAMTQSDAVKSAVEATLPTLTSIDLDGLRDAIVPILTAWGGPDLQTRSDVPVLVEANLDGTSRILDFAVMDGNQWRTASGDELLDGNGDAVTSVGLSELLAQPVEPGTEWRVLDGAVIGFLERYLGEPLPLAQVEPGNRAAVNAAERFLELITERLNGLAVRLAAQGPLVTFFDGVTYDAVADTFKPTSDRQLIPMFEAIFTAAKQQGNPINYLERWQPTISAVLSDFDRGADYLQISKAYIFANIVAAYESVGLTQDIKDIAAAFTIPPEDIITGSGVVEGSPEFDIFYMDGSDQIAKGGLGSDVYVFGKNFGQDVIEDEEPPLNHSDDMIRFADIKSTEVTATREDLDLILTVDATGDSVRVKSQFDGETPSLFGGDLSEDYGVTEIIFSDGVVWNLIDIARAVSRPEASSDNISGTPTIDFLDGGAGDDFLSGGDDSDTYRFGRNYGNDVIHEAQENLLVSGPDYVTFEEGIALSDVIFDRSDDSDNLIVRIPDDTGQLTVEGQFDATYTGPFGKQWFDRVELFTFADGTFLDWEEVQKKVLENKKTESDDIIYGFDTEDVVDGGAGNDFLSAGNENDTYLFGLGYGEDTILEGMDNILGGSQDTVRFLAGVTPESVTFSRDGGSDDLLITLDDGSRLIIQEQFTATYTGPFGKRWFNRIENFQFADGTVLTANDVVQKLLQIGTPGDDEIYGFALNDVLDGGAGNDRLEGFYEGDTYIFGPGYGQDTIFDQEYPLEDRDIVDKVIFKPGINPEDIRVERDETEFNLVLNVQNTDDQLILEDQVKYYVIGPISTDIEEFYFDNGTVWTSQDIREFYLEQATTEGDDTITGFFSDDTIIGGTGNDTLAGGDGSDTYVFNVGDGQDVIAESVKYVTFKSQDRIVFGPSFKPDDFTVGRVGDDLLLISQISTDQLTIKDFFSSLDYFQVEFFEFSDGTVWTVADINNLYVQNAGSDGDDSIEGTYYNDFIDPGKGNDSITDPGGSDTYIFQKGYGQDVIWDRTTHTSDPSDDRVLFGPGIKLEDLSLDQNTGEDLVITFLNSTDKLTVRDYFNRTQYNRIETFEFADGTQLEWLDIKERYFENVLTDGNDVVLGTHENDDIELGLGDDSINDPGGSDLYRFNLGDGQDVVWDRTTHISDASNDRVLFGPGIKLEDLSLDQNTGEDLVITFLNSTDKLTVRDYFNRTQYNRIETFEFADGTQLRWSDIKERYLDHVLTDGDDVVLGTHENDFIELGLGDDSISDPGGSDLYKFNLGDGQDVVWDRTTHISDASNDRVVFGPQVKPVNVTFREGSSDDLIFEFDGSRDRLTIRDHFRGTGYSEVESFEFADGTVWSSGQILDWISAGLDRADLGLGAVITSFDVIDDQVLLGQATLSFTLENQGSSFIDTFEVQVVYSDDDIIGNDDDQVVGSHTMTDMLTGLSVTDSLTVQLPQALLNSRAQRDDAPSQGTGYVSSSVDIIALTTIAGNVLAIDDITYFPWDIDGNGQVTPSDAIYVINRLGQTTTVDNALADFDGSGQITPSDAIAAINRLGYSINSSVIEPVI